MNDNNEYQVARDLEQHEKFNKDNPDLIVNILEIGDSDRPNANGMIFPKEVVEKAVKDLQNRVKEKTLLVFDNIDGNSGYNDLMRAGALITDVEVNGNRVNAKIKIINTMAGERISACLKSGNTILRTQLSIDCKVIGIYAENISKIPFPK